MNTLDLWVEDPACLPPSRFVCCVDPITLGGLALAGLAGGAATAAATSSSGAPITPTPTAPPPPTAAPAAATPAPKNKPQQPTFIGGVPAPPPSTGQKTLLGQ